MKFTDLQPGDTVFVDANIFIYHCAAHPVFGPPCADLMQTIENKTVTGFTSANVLVDVAHRLMTLEAQRLWGWPMTGMAARLRRHPTQVQQLSRYRLAIDEITLIGVQIVNVSASLVSRAADICRQFGMLMNDAIIVAAMNEHGLNRLASQDADFDRVPALTRYEPI